MTDNTLRGEAASRANEQRQDLIAALVAIAKGGETTTSWHAITCKHCRRDGKYELAISNNADPAVVIRAIEALDKLGFGKPDDGTDNTTIDHSKDPGSLTPGERTALRAHVEASLGAPAPARQEAGDLDVTGDDGFGI